MEKKRKWNDGLDDILEWIDNEVLVHESAKTRSTETNITKKRTKIYGNNEVGLKKPRAKTGENDESHMPEPAVFNDELEVQVDKKLTDRARGLINRLSAQNTSYIIDEFEKLYATNRRSHVNEALFTNIEASLISKQALAKRKLVAEQMLLVVLLDNKISHDIGASLIHRLIRTFEKLYSDPEIEEPDKCLENILLCILNLYVIGLISAKLVFELTKRICNRNFRIKSVELLLLLVKSVGFQLRKDDPSLTRQLIIMAQDGCKSLKDERGQLGSRVEFMVEALSAIKNNNMNKLVNYGCDIDRDTIESVLKGLIKRIKIANSLSDASYEEILNSPNWYLLETRLEEEQGDKDHRLANKTNTTNVSKTDAKVCKALGLNKPAERTIFSALLRVSDYVEASNVIIGYGMSHCSDAMLVCVHVAMHEKKYNPFHFNLINSLCKFNRRYKMAAKFAIQDKVRVLSQLTSQRVAIFKVLCLDLIKSDAVPITILKATEWADMSKSTKEFLIHLLEGVSELSDEDRAKVMSKVDKRSSFAGAMRTFTNCFLKGCKLF